MVHCHLFSLLTAKIEQNDEQDGTDGKSATRWSFYKVE
jgi:hypothetical protein